MLTTTPEIDVRALPPAHRHPTVFGVMAGLQPGGSMIVTSDHDPMSLRRQIETRHPEQFVWDYLEQGPEVWRVEIRHRAPTDIGCRCGG